MKRYLITGGAGAIGGSLTKALCEQGHRVVVFDDGSRGNLHRLEGVPNCHHWTGDVCEYRLVESFIRYFTANKEIVNTVIHLAAVNGTKNFYENPSRVLEVGVKGIVNVIDACVAHGVKELFVASSSEVYQTPPSYPTPEDVPLTVPDPHNPRYSYGASKIITEMMALHYKPESFDRVVVFRPHNIIGGAFGEDHVVPEFIRRALKIRNDPPPIEHAGSRFTFAIEGWGNDQRSFCHVDDCVSGILTLLEKGKHREIYNIGTTEEVSMRKLADMVCAGVGVDVDFVNAERKYGGTRRRCPDISKLRSLGWEPKVSLEEGLEKTISWYTKNPKEKENV